MIILHAGASDGRLVLWGESPQDVTGSQVRRRGRAKKSTGPLPYPFDTGSERLAGALQEFGSPVSARPGRFQPWAACCPRRAPALCHRAH